MNYTKRRKCQQLKTHRMRMSVLRAIPNIYEALKWVALPDYAPANKLAVCDAVLRRIFKCDGGGVSTNNLHGIGSWGWCDVYRVVEQNITDVPWFSETKTTSYFGIMVREIAGSTEHAEWSLGKPRADTPEAAQEALKRELRNMLSAALLWLLWLGVETS